MLLKYKQKFGYKRVCIRFCCHTNDRFTAIRSVPISRYTIESMSYSSCNDLTQDKKKEFYISTFSICNMLHLQIVLIMNRNTRKQTG